MLSGCLHPLFSEQRGTDQLDWQTVQYDIANTVAVIWLMCYLDKERDQEAFQGGSVVKNPPANAGDSGSILGSGRSPGVGNGNPFQYSCLGNPMNRGVWWATIHRVARNWTRLSDWARMHTHIKERRKVIRIKMWRNCRWWQTCTFGLGTKMRNTAEGWQLNKYKGISSVRWYLHTRNTCDPHILSILAPESGLLAFDCPFCPQGFHSRCLPYG